MPLQTATNPETGEQVVLVNNEWQPVAQTATNQQGQKAFLVGNQWILEQPPAVAPVRRGPGDPLPQVTPGQQVSQGAGFYPSGKPRFDPTPVPNEAKLGEAQRNIEMIQAQIAQMSRRNPNDPNLQVLRDELDYEQTAAAHYASQLQGGIAQLPATKPAAAAPTKPTAVKPTVATKPAEDFEVTDPMGFGLPSSIQAVAGPQKTVTRGLDIEAMPQQFKSGVAGMQQSYFTGAAKSAAEQLNLMDRIDKGERVAPAQDPLGYQDMTPEQRAKTRAQFEKVLPANVAKAVAYGAEQQTYVKNPMADAMVQAANKGNWREAWKAFSSDPIGVVQQLSVQSTPNALPSLAGGAAGVLMRGGIPALMTGLATGSFPVEYMSSLVDSLQDAGVDVRDAKAVEAKLRDPAFLEAAGKKAVTRGTVIAAADALSGRLMMPLKAGQLGKNIRRGAVNLAIEPATEAGGEALAQAATGEFKPGEIIAEALGAGPQAVATTALSTAAESAKPAEAAPPTAPQAAPPVAPPTAPAAQAAPPVTPPTPPVEPSKVQGMFKELEETSGLAEKPAQAPAPEAAPTVTQEPTAAPPAAEPAAAPVAPAQTEVKPGEQEPIKIGNEPVKLQFMANRTGSGGTQNFGIQYQVLPLTEENWNKYRNSDISLKNHIAAVEQPENLGYKPTHIVVSKKENEPDFSLYSVGNAKDFEQYFNSPDRKQFWKKVDDFASEDAKQFGRLDDEEVYGAASKVPKTAPPVAPPVAEAPAETKAETPAPVAVEPKEKIEVPEGFKVKEGRKAEVVLAARALNEGRLTKDEYDWYVNTYAPIEPILAGKMETPINDDVMYDILVNKIKGQKKNPKLVNAPIADGTRVGLRMDIPALNYGRKVGINGSVVSIHEGKDPNAARGENISYKSTGHIKNVVMAPRSEESAFKVAQMKEGREGEKKPQQTMEGEWINTSPEETLRLVREHFNDPNWVQVSLDPLRHSYFYARDSKRPVLSADEALQVGRFVLVKNPVYGDRQQFLYNIESILDVPVGGDPDQRSQSYKREAKKLTKAYEDGKISSEQFAGQMGILKRQDDQQRAQKEKPPLVRGAYQIKEQLNEAARKGWISEDAYQLAEWFINSNPRLVEDLAISLQGKGQKGVVGTYDSFNRLMILIKNKGNDNTIVHEILHHLERMMPQEVQDSIRKEWTKRLLNAQKQSKTELEKFFFDALIDHHFGENRIGDLDLAPKMVAELNKMGFDFNLDTPSSKVVKEMLKRGTVPISNYQYYSPSEFWAVNGSDIVRGRYNAIKGGVLTRLKNWLRELGQKIKSIFGLSSDAPILRALDSLAKADGQFVTNDLLDQAQTLFSIEKEAKAAPRTAGPKKTIEPSKIDRQRDTWMIAGRDELGRPNFGPGAKAYDAVARIANAVLDKANMKPVSPELGRAIRNMKVQVDKAQKQIASLAKELAKMSPQERQLISDVIEGELEAGITPPQHVLDVAASMQSIMTKQSQELVRLGMLSKEAANRWENKYLPRFYQQNIGKEAKAWANATKRLLMKQPMMQGIKGSQLKSRGMYQTIYTEDLPNWIAEGWEQRDPGFDPKTSEETVVWRDYTREERENMGEIRDAMFRFVMGYNASQRDIALGRLYENLAENYASKVPMEDYVQVPDTKIEGTQANRYGKLAGMYVPKEIMDHLVWNDQAMANGLYKLYKAGLARWKEGKTVLNPVTHANNVFSNFTMAHFAGVSYWDLQKYAGAIRDFVKNNDMLKEAEDVGLFTGTFSQEEMVKDMPPELRQLADMTESQLAKYGDKVWDLMSFTLQWDGKKYGVRPAMKWMYENEDLFFRYLIYRDARNRGMEPEDAREYSQQFIFTYDDLPAGARTVRDIGMPFFAYTYKVVPVLARTAMEYPWRFAAPAAALYGLNALMYSLASSLGGDEDDWWGKVLYKYATDKAFRDKANQLEEEERKNLPPWMKGSTALGTPKAVRLGMDEATNLPLFIDTARIVPGGDMFDAENNAGGVGLLQPIIPNNPVLTTMYAMFANRDTFFGKDVVNNLTDTKAEKAQKRAAWLWKQWAPAISVGNYHFDRAMNTVAHITGEPITVDAGPLGVIDYSGVGKDGLPVIPKYAVLQTFGVKVRPYDLEVSEEIEGSKQNQMIKELAIEITRINKMESKKAISSKAAELLRERAKAKQDLLKDGLTIEGEEKK